VCHRVVIQNGKVSRRPEPVALIHRFAEADVACVLNQPESVLRGAKPMDRGTSAVVDNHGVKRSPSLSLQRSQAVKQLRVSSQRGHNDSDRDVRQLSILVEFGTIHRPKPIGRRLRTRELSIQSVAAGNETEGPMWWFGPIQG